MSWNTRHQCLLLLSAAALLAGCTPGSPKIVSQIQRLAEAGQLERATALAESARIQFPTDPAVYASWAEVLLHDPELVNSGRDNELIAADPGGEEASRVLARAVRHRVSTVRANAVRLLGRHFGPASAELLRQAAEDPSEEVRRAALNQLRRLRDPAAATVVRLSLKDSSWAVRAEAVAACVAIEGAKAIPRIAPLLVDADSYVRHEAAKALLGLAQPGSEAAFRSLVSPEQPRVLREVGALALAALRDGSAPDLLAWVVKNGSSEHRHEAARLLADHWPDGAGRLFAELAGEWQDPVVALVAARFFEERGATGDRELAARYRALAASGGPSADTKAGSPAP